MFSIFYGYYEKVKFNLEIKVSVGFQKMYVKACYIQKEHIEMRRQILRCRQKALYVSYQIFLPEYVRVIAGTDPASRHPGRGTVLSISFLNL